jgi:Protein of unknown function (DUF1064)
MRLSVAEYKALSKKKRGNKYHAIPCAVDEFRFDSKAEADFYRILKKKLLYKEISFFLRQTPFHLPGNVKLVADFIIFYPAGNFEVMDVKGDKPTALWTVKRKTVEAIYPVKIKIIKKREVNELKKQYFI